MARFVLVHGAFDGGFVFQRLAALLRRGGHQVFTPTLTGSGDAFHLLSRDVRLETHIQDVASFLFHEDLRDVVLLGHSYGGTVVTGAADREPARVRRIVYLDASAPVSGQCASGAFADGTADTLTAMSAGDGWLLPPLPLAAIGVTSPEDVAWLAPRRHPHPLHTLNEPLALSPRGLDAIPRTYLRCLQHEGLVALFGVDPLAGFVERARREGWEMRDLDAPHEAMVTAPGLVAGVLATYE